MFAPLLLNEKLIGSFDISNTNNRGKTNLELGVAFEDLMDLDIQIGFEFSEMEDSPSDLMSAAMGMPVEISVVDIKFEDSGLLEILTTLTGQEPADLIASKMSNFGPINQGYMQTYAEGIVGEVSGVRIEFKEAVHPMALMPALMSDWAMLKGMADILVY